MDSNTRNPNKNISENNPNEPDKEERDINLIINSARNINELCVLLTELQYHKENIVKTYKEFKHFAENILNGMATVFR